VLRGRSYVALWAAFATGVALAHLSVGRPPQPREVQREPTQDPTFTLESTVLVERVPLPAELVRVASQYNLDPVLVSAIIEVESGFDPGAVSAKGAVGLMQVLPETAALVGFPEAADPARNLEAGCRYLASLLESFGGDVELALAAYNAGPGAVRRWGTIPPYRETQTFIARVADAYQRLSGLELRTAVRMGLEPSGLF
jgi:soluble lytic murein transglycosylase-like protein